MHVTVRKAPTMSARSRNAWRDYRWRESAWTRTRAVVALGMVFGLGAVGTMAQWSQTVTAETGLFSTSVIDLTINDQTTTVSLSDAKNLARGGSAAGIINLQNNGDLSLGYVMDLGVSPLTTQEGAAGFERGNAEKLRQNSTVSMYLGGTVSGTTCSGGQQVFSQLGPANTSSALSGRSLPGHTTDSYCVQVSVAATAPVESRMAQVGYTFTFNASVA